MKGVSHLFDLPFVAFYTKDLHISGGRRVSDDPPVLRKRLSLSIFRPQVAGSALEWMGRADRLYPFMTAETVSVVDVFRGPVIPARTKSKQW